MEKSKNRKHPHKEETHMFKCSYFLGRPDAVLPPSGRNATRRETTAKTLYLKMNDFGACRWHFGKFGDGHLITLQFWTGLF